MRPLARSTPSHPVEMTSHSRPGVKGTPCAVDEAADSVLLGLRGVLSPKLAHPSRSARCLLEVKAPRAEDGVEVDLTVGDGDDLGVGIQRYVRL